MKGDGEIKVEAASGGRRITLDPIRTFSIPVEVREVESTIPCGFQSVWLTASDEGKDIGNITAGAGVGSKWGTIKVGDRCYCFDAGELLAAVIEQAKETKP